jgi:hypothetical protein
MIILKIKFPNKINSFFIFILYFYKFIVLLQIYVFGIGSDGFRVCKALGKINIGSYNLHQ